MNDRFVQGAQLGPWHLLGWVGSEVSKLGVLSTEDPVLLAGDTLDIMNTVPSFHGRSKRKGTTVPQPYSWFRYDVFHGVYHFFLAADKQLR